MKVDNKQNIQKNAKNVKQKCSLILKCISILTAKVADGKYRYIFAKLNQKGNVSWIFQQRKLSPIGEDTFPF